MRFYWGIQPRCSLCPLFDAERAVRDALGENSPPELARRISLGPLGAEGQEGDVYREPDWQAPDYLPTEWEEQAGEKRRE